MLQNKAGHFSEHFLSDLRQKVPLSAIVRERCRLVEKGGRLVACCPFHQEKTPSFSVSDEKGFFYCFGCGAKGDVFHFLMQMNGLTFPQAVEDMAKKAGVDLPTAGKQETKESLKKEKSLQQLELLCQFYEDCLWGEGGTSARAYLEDRGFSQATCQYFRIGFSPNRGGATADLWSKKGWDGDLLSYVGNLSVSKTGLAYDRFAGRLIFPVFNIQKKVIAFSGRVLGNAKVAKYLNSPETPIFHKKYVLYNSAVLRGKQKKVYLVEGFTDVMRLYQAEQAIAVSTMGTAISSHQIELLWRSCDVPLVLLDGDKAGKSAAQRLVEIVLPLLCAGKSLNIQILPEGMDPDTYIATSGNQIESLPSMPLNEYLWAMVEEIKKPKTPEDYAALEKTLSEYIGMIKDPSVRKYYKQYCEKKTFYYTRSASVNVRVPSYKPKGAFMARHIRERIVLSALCLYPELLSKMDEKIANICWTQPDWSSMVECVLRAYVQHYPLTTYKILRILCRECDVKDIRLIYNDTLYTHAPYLFVKSDIADVSLAVEDIVQYLLQSDRNDFS